MRSSMTKKVAAIFAASLIAAACGSDNKSSGATIPPATGDQTTTAPSGTNATAPSGTNATAPSGTNATAPGGRGVIAFSYGNESAGIYPIVAGPARTEAEARGYKFIEGSANGDCDKQVKDLENFVVQKVAAIVVLPLCGVEPLKPVMADAKKAGIKVVGYSTELSGGDGAIVYKNVDGANAVAAEAVRWYNNDFKGDKTKFAWALFTYDQCGKACTDRTDPIRAAITKATGVKPLEAESVDETSGQKATETFLQKNPDLAMVIGINDAGALGAYQAMTAAIGNGRDPGTIFVGGMDGQIEALQLIANAGGNGGIYRASGALILDNLGRAVADLPADLIEGKSVSVLELPYELITPTKAARAGEIVATYKKLTKK